MNRWWTDEYALSSIVISVALSGALFIGSAGVLLSVSQDQADDLDSSSADTALLRGRAQSLASLVTRSPGYAADGGDWLRDSEGVQQNSRADAAERLGLADLSGVMLDYEKFDNLRLAPYAANHTDGRLNYEEAREALDLADDGLDFHIRAYPSLPDMRDRVGGLRDPNLKVTYIGDYYREGGNGNGNGNGNGGQAPDDGLVVGNPTCGVSPDSDRVLRLTVDVTNGGTSTTQFLVVMEPDFPGNQDPRGQDGAGFTDPSGSFTTFTVDFPAAGYQCSSLADLVVEVHDPQIKLFEGSVGAVAGSGTATTTTTKMEFLSLQTWWEEGDTVRLDYAGLEKEEEYDFDVYVGDDASGASISHQDGNVPNPKSERFVTIDDPLAEGTYTAKLTHPASGVALTQTFDIVAVDSTPLPYTPPGSTIEDVDEYHANPPVEKEVLFIEQLVQNFCPYLYNDQTNSPLLDPPTWEDRCRTVKNGASSQTGSSSSNEVPIANIKVTCIELDCQFDAGESTDDVGIVLYEWDFGDGNTFATASPDVFQHSYATESEPDDYVVQLTVTDTAGAQSHDVENNHVNENWLQDITEKPGTNGKVNPPIAVVSVTCEDLGCDFFASGSGGTIAQYLWDFGDGQTSSQVTPSHNYAAGEYTVSLTVTGNDDTVPYTPPWSMDVETLSVAEGTSTQIIDVRPGDVFPDLRDDLQDELSLRLVDNEGNPSLEETNVLVVGSMVDHQPMVHIKDEVADWVALGGYLIVFGSEDTNTQWMQSIFHIGIHSSSGELYYPDEQHPLLHVTEELDYVRYENQGDVWKFTGQSQKLFTTIAASDDQSMVLGVSDPGAFDNGNLAVTSWFTNDLFRQGGDVADLEGLKFMNNLLMLGYRGLFLDYGPPLPPGAEVVPAVARAPIEHPELGFVPMTIIVYVFPGSTA